MNAAIIRKYRAWGAELNWELVSCRVCVRAVCMSSEIGVNIYGRAARRRFPFSCFA